MGDLAVTTAVRRWVLIAAAVSMSVAGCGTTHRTASAAGGHPSGQAASSTTGARPSTTDAPTTTIPTTTTTTGPPPEQPGWTVVYETGSAIVVDKRTISLPDGTVVTLARFHAGSTSFALHVGSLDPPTGNVAVPAGSGSAVTASERPLLLGAFNGGFKAATGAGGFEVDGLQIMPLRSGYASLVIDSNGTAHVGAWGAGLPAPGEQVVSVRQNLLPLVTNGVASPAAGNVAAWGATIQGIPNVARSALGEDAQGNLIYAGSMHALPSDLATALIEAGARNAMELDINPEWVQLDLASTPGGPFSAAIPGQNRPADQYLYGWTRDFVTVSSTRA